jgi:hypothetical protein
MKCPGRVIICGKEEKFENGWLLGKFAMTLNSSVGEISINGMPSG